MWTMTETAVPGDPPRENLVICMSYLTRVASNRRKQAKGRAFVEIEQMAGQALHLYSLSSKYQNDGDFLILEKKTLVDIL